MFKSKYKPDEILEIYWLDASTCQNWKNTEYLEKAACSAPCKSVGYFYKETLRDIITSKSVDLSEGDRSDTESIPKGMIVKIRRLDKSKQI